MYLGAQCLTFFGFKQTSVFVDNSVLIVLNHRSFNSIRHMGKNNKTPPLNK